MISQSGAGVQDVLAITSTGIWPAEAESERPKNWVLHDRLEPTVFDLLLDPEEHDLLLDMDT
jgi:hypothetical protein